MPQSQQGEPAQSRFGVLVSVPRRFAWTLVRPFVDTSERRIVARADEEQRRREHLEQKVADLTDSINTLTARVEKAEEETAAARDGQSAVKKDLLATNHRIEWLAEGAVPGEGERRA